MLAAACEFKVLICSSAFVFLETFASSSFERRMLWCNLIFLAFDYDWIRGWFWLTSAIAVAYSWSSAISVLCFWASALRHLGQIAGKWFACMASNMGPLGGHFGDIHGPWKHELHVTHRMAEVRFGNPMQYVGQMPIWPVGGSGGGGAILCYVNSHPTVEMTKFRDHRKQHILIRRIMNVDLKWLSSQNMVY